MGAVLRQRLQRKRPVQGGAGAQGAAVLGLQPGHLAAVLRSHHCQLAVLIYSTLLARWRERERE